MVHRFSRLALAALLAAAAAVYAGDAKCPVSAREECGQQIRTMLSGKRYHGILVEERKPGLFIRNVADQSPAWKAGLRPGDRLISVNNKSMTQGTAREFKQVVADARESGKVDVIIWRSGAYRRINVRLEPYTKEQMDKIIAGHLASHSTSTAGSH